MTPHVRYALRRDMLAVLAIEAASHPYPWDEDMFLRVLRQRTIIGFAAETIDHGVVGFGVYEIMPDDLRVVNFAVHPRHRLQGVGRAMIHYLRRKVETNNRRGLLATVREGNMGGLKFARSVGFVATGLVRGHCQETGEDGIAMRFREPEAAFTL